MVNTGLASFDSTVQKSIEWLNGIQEELGWEDRNMVYTATKAVLQTLRDRLPVYEAAHLGAQFPALMRGYYYEGYNPSDKPDKTIDDNEDFYMSVQKKTVNEPIDPAEATHAVFMFLKSHMSGGEIEDIIANMPNGLKNLWD